MTTWQELAQSAASCTRCDLYKRATATVFGEGKPTAAQPNPEARERSYAGLVADLVSARAACLRGPS